MDDERKAQAPAPSERPVPPLLERMRETIKKHDMVESGRRVLVAVSGGPDSSALLHALSRLRHEWRLMLHVYHLDHGARGAQSAEDAEYVRDLAGRLGFPCTVERRPVKEEAERLGGRSFQDVARAVRYERFEHVARSVGADRVALGHTADDQAETVLMRVLRGSGARGLSGIPAVRGMFIRPLIHVRRRDVEAYCRYFDLRPRTDPTNLTGAYVRNRVRNELIPFLEREFQPSLRENLVESAELLREDDRHLEEEARAAFQRLTAGASAGDDGAVTLDVAAFLELSPALRRRVLRRAYAAVRGDLKQLRKVHVDDAIRLAEEGRGWEGARLAWPGGVSARLVRPAGGEAANGAASDIRLEVVGRGRAPEGRAAAPAAEPPRFLPGPGRSEPGREWTIALWGGAGELTGKWVDETDDRAGATDRSHTGGQTLGNMKGSASGRAATVSAGTVLAGPLSGVPVPAWAAERELVAQFDADHLEPPLWVRPREDGDRLRPWGLGGSKKVKALLTDSRVPPAWRPRVPIVGDGGGILWVAGMRRSERAPITARTRRRLVLAWRPSSEKRQSTPSRR